MILAKDVFFKCGSSNSSSALFFLTKKHNHNYPGIRFMFNFSNRTLKDAGNAIQVQHS